jgi:LysM repeat protein
MDRRTRRSPARFLAPLALIAVLGAFLAIINASGDTSGSRSGSDTGAATTSKTTSTTKSSTTSKTSTTKTVTGSKTYVIQVGDTLGGIADKTGVPLERIEELNPDVDPHALTSGQTIKLR